MKRFILLLTVGLTLWLCACSSGETIVTQGGEGTTVSESETMSWQNQYDLGVRFLDEGNYEEAILAFTAAIEIDPKQSRSYIGRGDTYAAVAQAEMAGLEENAQLTASASEAYLNAAADYAAAIERESSLAEAYEKAAQTYVALGDTDAAIAILEQGVEATGDEGLAQYLEELRNGGLARVTVVGRIIYNPDEYQEEWENYLAIYQTENTEEEDGLYCSIRTFGVRFESPVECVIDGETVEIEETGMGRLGPEIRESLDAQLYDDETKTPGPLLNQRIEMTGVMEEWELGEIEEERDENGVLVGYCYNPNGKYVFSIENYTVLPEE